MCNFCPRHTFNLLVALRFSVLCRAKAASSLCESQLHGKPNYLAGTHHSLSLPHFQTGEMTIFLVAGWGLDAVCSLGWVGRAGLTGTLSPVRRMSVHPLQTLLSLAFPNPDREKQRRKWPLLVQDARGRLPLGPGHSPGPLPVPPGRP